jgi:hypothetical protein
MAKTSAPKALKLNGFAIFICNIALGEHDPPRFGAMSFTAMPFAVKRESDRAEAELRSRARSTVECANSSSSEFNRALPSDDGKRR